MRVMAIAHFRTISPGHVFHDFDFLLFFTRSVRPYRLRFVRADGGFLDSTSVLSPCLRAHNSAYLRYGNIGRDFRDS